MKTVLQIIAIFIVAYIAELLLPWWYSVAIVAFVFGYLLRSQMNFLAGFIAIVILWGFEIWLIDSSASVDLLSRVSAIFKLERNGILVIITLVLGGLVGGFAALSGALLKPKRRKHEMKYR